MQLSYRGLKIELPVEGIEIDYFCLKEALNDHGKLILHILMDESKIFQSIEEINECTCVTVLEQSKDKKSDQIIFKGRVLTAQMIKKQHLSYLTLECVAYTYDWDLEKKSRSFCDLDCTYKQIIEKILKDYPKKDFWDKATKGKKIPDFLLQYEETDWEYLKRLATHFETFLLPDCKENFGRIYFGLPQLQYGTTLEENQYILEEDLAQYYFFSALADYFPQETMTWKIQSLKRLYLGEEVFFKTIQAQVTKVQLETVKDELVYKYTLNRLKGVRLPYKTNPNIFGMSIPAVVKERKGNCIRVHFDIDTIYEQKPNLKFFTYAIESSSFYCMPEEGSKVHIYFPSHNEHDAIAVNAIRTNQGSAVSTPKNQNPNHKSFSNTTGSEMQLTPSNISFAADSAKKISITLDDQGNINLLGKTISLSSEKNIQLGQREAPPNSNTPPVKPKSIKISAKEKVSLTLEGDEAQGVVLDEAAKIIDTFIKKDASVQKAPTQSPESFKQKAQEEAGQSDEALISAKNNGAKEALVAKKEEGLAKIRKGIGSIVKVIGTVAIVAGATIITGGVAGPVLITAMAVTGTMQVAMGASDIIEGSRDVSKSQTGDLTASSNPICDMFFGGNKDLYHAFQGGVELTFGIVSSIALGSVLGGSGTAGKVCGEVKKACIHASVNAATTIIDDYADDKKIDVKNLAINTGLGFVAGKIGDRILGRVGKVVEKYGGEVAAKVLHSDLGKKAFHVTAGSLVDTGVDFGISEITNRPFDFKQSLRNNTFANLIAALVGEPIDAITGTFIAESIDFVLPDIGEDFAIKRQYMSTNLQEGVLGKGWKLNYESYMYTDSNKLYVECVTGHSIGFENKQGKWEALEGQGKRFALEENKIQHEWILKDYQQHQTYVYNKEGKLTAIINKNNQKTLLMYENGNLSKILTTLGYEVYFTFKENKLIEIQDSIGRTVQYKYDEDLLTHAVQLDHGITHYIYNKTGYLETTIDANGTKILTNTYDEEGRIVFQTLENGETYQFEYDTTARTSIVTYGTTNHQVIYHYNKNLAVTKITYEDQRTQAYDYDVYGNRCYEKDRLGRITQKAFSPYGYCVAEELPNGNITTYTYDEMHRLTRKSDTGGRESLYRYNERNNLVEEKYIIATGRWATIHYTYDFKGRILQVEDAMKGITQYTYEDKQSKPTSIISPMGETTDYEYDAVGRRMSIENTYGKVEFGYNALNYVTSIKDGEGNVSRKMYDKMGNLISYYTPKALKQGTKGYDYKYDFLDRLVEVVNPLEEHFKNFTNTEGKITKSIHPNTYDPKTGDGEGIYYCYDQDNNCIKKINLDGGTERFFYDAEGNLIKHVLPEYYDAKRDDGIGYTYTYNAMNQLTHIVSPEGIYEHRYTYDLHGNMIEETDAKGQTTYYHYDLKDNLIEKRSPIKVENEITYYQVVRYEYDLNGNKIAEKYGEEAVEIECYPKSYHTITLTYNANNHLIKVKDDMGATVVYRYNCLGKRSYEERLINRDTRQTIYYNYNAVGRLTQKKEACNPTDLNANKDMVWAITQYQYDENGNLIEITTPKGYKIKRTYDACDRMISQQELDKANGIDRTHYYHYDAAGNVIAVTQTSEQQPDITTGYTYDLKNRLTHIKEGENTTTRYFYDKNDNLIKEVTGENYQEALDDGEGTTYTYNYQGRLTSCVNALGEIVETNYYDAIGNRIERKDGLGNSLNYYYTPDDQLEKITASMNQAETTLGQYSYNEKGQIIGIKDGNENETFYDTDSWGRITKIRSADGGVERYQYDHAGNITQTTDANGNTITYVYNSFNKVSEIIDQEGFSEKFYYDEEGRMVSHHDRNGNDVQTRYNIDGNIIEEVATHKESNQTVWRSYQYDSQGKLIRAKTDGLAYRYHYTPEGRLKSKETCGKTLIDYTYNKNGQIQSIKDISGKTSIYQYDLAGRLESIRDDNHKTLAKYTYQPDNHVKTITYENGIKTTYQYDNLGNILGLITTTATGEVLIDNHYTYDLNGNRLEKTGIKHHHTYSYDQRNRLISAQYNTQEEHYTYDKVGNRLTKTSQEGSEQYTYNHKNQLISLETPQGTKVFTYDKQGNTIKEDGYEGVTSFNYNPLNQQIKVTLPNGNSLVNRYDAEGLRAEIEENNRLTKFIFHQDTILEELDAEDNTKARLITGHGIIAANIKDIDNNYYYHQDEQGSTAIITDENADIKNSYHYDAFGKILESQEALPNRITYTGQQYDPLTQQYYLRARYYNPIIGRFTQEDTYRGDGLNLYAYCSNNPVSYYDPTGYAKEASPPCKAPAVTDADGGNTKKATEAGKLKSVGNGKWESPEGLIYEQGSIHGNRVKHVLDHTVPNPNKPSHTIFKVDKNKVIGLVDEAWKSRDTATVNRGNDLYDISMGKIVGTKGEKKIRIVTKRGTNKILSAYPR